MFCEAFSIDPEVATQLASFHRWYGIQIIKPDDNEQRHRLGKEDRLAIAATSLRQAGMMFHIVDRSNDARESFEKSTECYSDAGNTYSFVMACCSGDRDMIAREALKYAEMKLPPIASKRREIDKEGDERGEIYAEFDRFPPNILLYFLMGKLTAITLGSNFVDNAVYPLVKFLDFYADQRVSIRGYPINQYLRLFNLLLNLQQNEDKQQTIHQIGGIFDRMLGTYEESILVAQKDRYHWENCAIMSIGRSLSTSPLLLNRTCNISEHTAWQR